MYLDGKYSYTVIGTILVIAIKPVINIFAGNYGVVAIATTTTGLFLLYAVNIALAMQKVTGNYMDKDLGINVLKILAAGVSALAVFVVCKIAFPLFMSDKVLFLIPLALCGAVYCAVLFLSGIVKVILKGRNEQTPQ